MQNYLTIEEGAKYLGVSVETIKRYIEKGELQVYKLERALRVSTENLDALLNLQVLLTSGVRAIVKHSHQTAPSSDAWRITVSFADTSEKKAIIPFGKSKHTEYFVWVTAEYLEDHARLPATIKGAEKFALSLVQELFEETRDENGDRSLEKIKYDKTSAAYGMLQHGADLTSPISYKNYTIRFTTEGFANMLPNVFGKVVVFLVSGNKDNKTSYMAFAQSGLNQITGDTEDAGHLIVRALDIIKARIDKNNVEDKKVYTYEYKFHQFDEVKTPEWWKELSPGYRI